MTPIWLLRLTYGGRSVYASSRPCEPLDLAARPVVHRGGIEDLTIAQSFELGGDDWLGETDAEVVAYLSPTAAALTAAGWRPDALRAEVSLLTPGAAYASRRVVMAGPAVLDVVAGGADPARIRIVPEDLNLGAQFPPDAATIRAGSTLTDPLAQPSAEGVVYPWVFGTPGAHVRADGTAGAAPASPCPYVATGYVMIAGHAVEASTVTIYSEPDDDSDDFAVTTATDLLGRVYSRCDVSAKIGVWTLGSSSKMFVSDWQDGGLVSPAGAARWRPSDLAAYLLGVQGVRVDHAALGAVRRRLDRVRLDAAIVERVLPWEWLTAQWAPLDPTLWWVQGARGLQPVVLDEGPTSAAPLLRVGYDWHRPDSRTTVTTGDGARGLTAASVGYALDRSAGEYSGRQRVAAREVYGDDPDGLAQSAPARRAASRGADLSSEIEAAAVYDATQAAATARGVIAARWASPVSDLLWRSLSDPVLRLGQLVRVQDTAQDTPVRGAWVTGIGYALDRVEYTVSYRA